MPNDRQMQEAQDKNLIQKLKQFQSIEKIAEDEKAPETADAARTILERLKEAAQPSAKDEIIQSLKQPRQPEPVDVSPLYALASPNVGQRLLQAQQLRQKSEQAAADEELDKLSTLAKLTVGNTGNSEQDMKALEKVGSMASGTGRGATNMRKAWENIASIDKLKSMAEDFASGRLTFDAESNTEYSSAISTLILNRAPGIEIIRATAYSHFGGDINKMIQYITGDPQDALSEKMMKEISRQILNIERAEKQKAGKTVSRLFNAYRGRFKKNPEDALLWKEQYGHLVNFDLDNMKSAPKPYKEQIETRLGLGEEKSNDKLERFRKALGR